MDDAKWHDVSYLRTLITENKRAKMEEVLAYRTRYVTIALEDIEQPHNASAVIRSADIFGVQDVHVIAQTRSFTPQNSIAKGALKWVDIYTYGTTAAGIAALKKDGYRIVATTPHARGYSLPQLPLDSKIALLFGTEVTGLSDQALALADAYVTIPMVGFTESLNISVSVSICLYHIVTQLHASSIIWQLPADEREALQLRWLKKLLHMVPD
jgi:tRNA (guanosine-2'-O-)-methyltransferase